jgi:SAM-dependent methyltransferase
VDVTNRFVLDFARDFAAAHPGAHMLDFGCGAGELVAAARQAGIDMLGADVFYGGSQTRPEDRAAPVHEIRSGRLTLPDAALDLIVNNQVLEHVEDLDAVLDELHRVLKPGGLMLSIFPSRDVFREGHTGIPFAHWFPRRSHLRYAYALALRSLGAGYWKSQARTRREWAAGKMAWLDAWTHYRRRPEIFRAFDRRFVNEYREPDYIRYRLRDGGHTALARLMDLAPARAAARALFRKLAFLVIVSRKEAA